MTAEPIPTPEPSPRNRQRDPVTAFREDYAAIVVDAERSAQHTATAGWQELYGAVRRDLLRERVRIAGELRRLADLADESGLTEDDEKDLGDAKKSAVELRQRWECFERDVVDAVRRPVKAAQDCLAHYRGAADRDEAMSPLINSGLVELMRIAIAEQRLVRWDDETGSVQVGAA